MARERLPNRRPALILTVTQPGDFSLKPAAYDVGVGFASDTSHEVREVFVSCNKTTTALDIAGKDIATLISIALQHGATVAELRDAMTRGDTGEAQGVAGAVLDAVHEMLSAAEAA